jgi:hypothetical protein
MAEQAAKQVYESALDDFIDADTEYRMLEKCILEGEFIPNMAIDGALLRQQYGQLMKDLRDALEERNARLKNLQDALRQKVTLTDLSKQRGPEGKPTVLNAGPFKATSVTGRWLDPKSLFDGVAKHGLLERLHDLKTLNKEGKEEKLVQQVWDIDYDGVMTWLKANGMIDVIDQAYDEKEKTPQVTGPKALSFLGDEKK